MGKIDFGYFNKVESAHCHLEFVDLILVAFLLQDS